MTEPGWYTNPDGSANERRWDGQAWTNETRDYPPPGREKVSGPNESQEASTGNGLAFTRLKRFPRWAWVVSAAVVVALAAMAFLIPSLSFPKETSQPAPQTAVTRVPSSQAPRTVAEPVLPALIPLGSPIVSPNFSLVINSVEVLDQIDTNYDGPIFADPGTKLVLVRSTITITGNAQDLTCGSDVFMQARDSSNSEMAPIFEGPRIPGNPECNFKTSAGETVSWNFAFKMGADRTPAIISVIDTNVDGNYGWGPEVLASLS